MSDNESDTSDVEAAAATKIQSVYKGHKTRKEYALQKSSSNASGEGSEETPQDENQQEEQEQQEQDQYAEEQHLAAATIQAQFRGYSTRKHLREERTKLEKAREQSAVKIQKVYRGHSQRLKFQEELENKMRQPKQINVALVEEKGDLETTLAIVKPDAVSKGHTQSIRRIIQQDGFLIIREATVRLSLADAEQFYKEHAKKEFFERLTTFMSSGPAHVMVLCRVNAIARWRQIIGPTNPQVAIQQDPKSIRALFGSQENPTHNAAHGSDSLASSLREIQFFFPTQPLFPAPSAPQAKDYVNSRVVPVLTDGLAQLCKQKPAEPLLWLADWLLHHNPNKPRVTEPTF